MSDPADWSLLSGGVPFAISAFGTAAAIFLVARRGRSWWLRLVAPVVAGAALLSAAAVLVVCRVWRPFPDVLPAPVIGWLGIGVAAIGVAGANWWRAPWWRQVATPLAAVLVVLTCAVQINVYYGQYPAVRNALGLPPHNMIDLDSAGTPTLTGSGLAPTGHVAEVPIPGITSGFKARHGWIYLPPNYRPSRSRRPGRWLPGCGPAASLRTSPRRGPTQTCACIRTHTTASYSIGCCPPAIPSSRCANGGPPGCGYPCCF